MPYYRKKSLYESESQLLASGLTRQHENTRCLPKHVLKLKLKLDKSRIKSVTVVTNYGAGVDPGFIRGEFLLIECTIFKPHPL